MTKRKKATTKPDERDNMQVLDELLRLGWKELKEKAEAERKAEIERDITALYATRPALIGRPYLANSSDA